MKKSGIIFAIIVGIFSITYFLCSCSRTNKTLKIPTVISDIAYDENSDYGYTVYLLENKVPTPYLVLTNDYNGNTLLMRKYVLSELKPFNDYSSYYRNSSIDKFLNNEFINVFSDEIKDKIVDTTIKITAKQALNMHGEQLELMSTKIFLLSFEELGYGAKSTIIAADEGHTLSFFSDDVERRIAYNEKNEISAWWVRTPDTGYLSAPFVVSHTGAIGSVNSYNENGVRPVFCIKNDTFIAQSNKIIENDLVYYVVE